MMTFSLTQVIEQIFWVVSCGICL